MIDNKQEISHLIDSIQSLAYRQEGKLEEYIHKIREIISLSGRDSHELINRLNKIRFKPASFFSTEMDYIKCWCQGQEELLKLLQELINSPQEKVFTEVASDISSRKNEPTLLKSSRLYERFNEQPELQGLIDQEKLNDIRSSLAQSIDSFKSTVLSSLPPTEPIAAPNELFVPKNIPLKEAESPKTVLRQKVFTLGNFPGNLDAHVVRFLQKQGLDLVSAHQWPYQEESIIEICKDKIPFDFCVVFLNPEYCMFPKDQSPLKAKWTLNPNIVFQLGFLVGKLGREKVIVLYIEESNLKRPTQHFELLYIPFDAQNLWQNALMTQLRNAGFIHA